MNEKTARRFLTILVCVAACLGSVQAQDGVRHSIFLIGDAGKDTLPGPALQMLDAALDSFPESSVVFLGDNIYPAGLEGKDGSEKKRVSELKLLTQLERTLDHRGYAFWVPGNHDWKAGRWEGFRLVELEAEFVEAFYKEHPTVANDPSTVFMPKLGLPGPEMERVDEHGYNIIVIDVQWWLQRQFFHKVRKTEGMTKHQMEERFLERLDSLITISKEEGKQVIVAAHHPMFSNGHHGAHKQPLRFMINWVPPFQLFGLIGLNRALVQDIPQPRYKRIRNRIVKILDKYEGLLYVSGHDHNLQYIPKRGNHFLVSGSGSKRSSLKHDREQAFFMNDENYGFMRLDMFADGNIKCHVYGHTVSGILQSFWLKKRNDD